ncbi:MAG: thioredoxin family protein [Rhodoferax sp.]|nr:thioredoxin family protein [Rhodoferax sp.]
MLNSFLRFATLLVAFCAIHTGATAQNSLTNANTNGPISAVVQTDQVRAELVAHAPQGIDPGKTVWVGLQLTHQPHWHTYWKNPGDSGLPTTLDWKLPPGVQAGAIVWPAPEKIAIGSLANFGYEGTVLLAVPLTIGPEFRASTVSGVLGDLEVRLNASWLVCRQECIPQDGDFVLRIPARGSMAMHGAAFDATLASAPKAHTGTVSARIENGSLRLQVAGLPAAWQGKALTALPEISEVAESNLVPSSKDKVASGSAVQTATQAWAGDVWTANMPLSAQRSASPTVLPVVLIAGKESLRVEMTVSGTWPSVAGGTGSAVTPTSAPSSTPANLGAWVFALGAALLGGLILNLMPCVFPVLAIKVLGFAGHAGHTTRSQRLQGLAYTAGVVLSFMALGGLMLALRAGGEQLGWGFQLQSPGVITLLAILFTLLGLNLAGLLEVGNVLPSSLASMQFRHPLGDAFLSGVLAVAIASPCTAPFMGASLGYAIALPAGQALGIFAALGLGLALPFLVASWVPQIGNWMPRPGPWMVQLRGFMAFPMWATVVWLLWVLGHLSGVDGAASLLALLLVLALLAWSLSLVGRARWVFASISIATLALLAGGIGQNIFKLEDNTPPAAGAATTWQPWSTERVGTELAQGKPVFVDFTAAWCITCQYNKKTTLANADVVGDFAAKKVTLLRADWTRRDPAITQALTALGRTGVPVYVLYRAGKPPVVLSELISVSEVRTALQGI